MLYFVYYLLANVIIIKFETSKQNPLSIAKLEINGKVLIVADIDIDANAILKDMLIAYDFVDLNELIDRSVVGGTTYFMIPGQPEIYETWNTTRYHMAGSHTESISPVNNLPDKLIKVYTYGEIDELISGYLATVELLKGCITSVYTNMYKIKTRGLTDVNVDISGNPKDTYIRVKVTNGVVSVVRDMKYDLTKYTVGQIVDDVIKSLK